MSGVDDIAQIKVAEQMRIRAASRSPDYILHLGDAFYWGGLDTLCGKPSNQVYGSVQLEWNFERVYTGPGLDGKQWLGILGNHDYGGWKFTSGWDQLIGYSWKPGGRWVMPAQYWRQIVRYPGFSVDYFFLDTNVFDTTEPKVGNMHNICGLKHNHQNATCGAEGPVNVWVCPEWFQQLWANQEIWVKEAMGSSIADWQILVTHFPPTWRSDYWANLCCEYGIDLMVSGHRHAQHIHDAYAEDNFLTPTPWIVSGGGGGVTSENIPEHGGVDDEYGFMELTLTKQVIEIVAISHGGQIRSTTFVWQRPRGTDC